VQGELKNAIDWADIVIMSSELYNMNDMAYEGWASAGPKNFTEYCKANGKKSVVMSVNFPYDTQLYPDADAVIAVYGWKGSGVDLTSADVIQKLLYGEITEDKDAFGPNITAGVEVIFGVYGASGKLPVNIPAFDAESKTYTDNILYKRGYGLTYSKLSPIPVLKKAAIKSLIAGKGKLKVKMTTSPSEKGGSYYRVAYKVKSSSEWKYKTTKSSGIVIRSLKRGKKYVVKVQAYTKVDGTKYYGA
jgi:beta-N-acetylhexosaminidase